MNIKNIGIDIIENHRFLDKISNEKFIKRVLSENEINEYQAINHFQKKLEFLASRYAAKEAFSKALGSYDGETSLHDIEVLHTEIGRPYINFIKEPTIKSLLSISHSDDYSVAQVIILE